MQKLHTPSVVHALAAAVLLAASGFSMAQTDAAAKPAAKPAAKKQPVVNPSSRTNLKSAAKNVAAGIEAAEAALTPAELAIAERVHVGKLPCELGAAVDLTADPKAPGYFSVVGKNFKYRMFPVATSTGAIRLEDQKAGAVWLQLANKSMLMNQKLGIRLADECMSPAQLAVAEAIKLNPPASVLDAPKPAVAAAPAAAAPGTSDASAVAAQPASAAK
ncbi:hypothetical protein PMI15_01710 [Polaromonas sp. CF318]|uniref:hypothetical protein n=1 Tax=Polaromonas sp. CF318 TaxID=1144318 RepID=UPI0002713CEE|nr:hypothetical protein [Polaromonas sp. CF318]EJL85683.1 hypothetical protein PMI15_01710 [Polaromonas sp. CF318]